MIDAVFEHGGTLVSYRGDGLLAVFGAPIPLDDHADRSLAAAREMLAVRLPRFNRWLRARDLGDGFGWVSDSTAGTSCPETSVRRAGSSMQAPGQERLGRADARRPTLSAAV
jgi:class 3 adenylate cyclase